MLSSERSCRVFFEAAEAEIMWHTIPPMAAGLMSPCCGIPGSWVDEENGPLAQGSVVVVVEVEEDLPFFLFLFLGRQYTFPVLVVQRSSSSEELIHTISPSSGRLVAVGGWCICCSSSDRIMTLLSCCGRGSMLSSEELSVVSIQTNRLWCEDFISFSTKQNFSPSVTFLWLLFQFELQEAMDC